ncbi:MAG TPA: DUF3597 domain-containing protein [Hypericibacter adhaerens]|jgi:hypothetical protein|uniref:DUF3597 domain-containing protein n=1 Tax=Hypericibacter adhaerens TaxID=2602016 RepID=A0A5J6MTW9_9PROT|nr:DUF3597 domain-containing protein [Hypericibacter adhaerens]QEX20185.1 hypothetical protein FRZ61_01000 [Hypericibacter adhaerens]HWA44061.1 DUF3597 domain-containing protein [Hypericibacter adhaerens]
MGWFDTIKNAIFGAAAKAEEAIVKAAPPPGAAPSAFPSAATASAAAPSVATPTAAAPAATVDVTAILDKAVAAKGQKLDWRKSIVDLLKAIDVDSSLSARKELAAELGYKGSTEDSAAMNIWLHKQVIQKLAANGGKVPPELLH